jgi:hypothetical protein
MTRRTRTGRSLAARWGALGLSVYLLAILIEAAPHQVHHVAPPAGDEAGCVLAAALHPHHASLPSLGPAFALPDLSAFSLAVPVDAAGACLARATSVRAPPS